jgi:hypothetical protein
MSSVGERVARYAEAIAKHYPYPSAGRAVGDVIAVVDSEIEALAVEWDGRGDWEMADELRDAFGLTERLTALCYAPHPDGLSCDLRPHHSGPHHAKRPGADAHWTQGMYEIPTETLRASLDEEVALRGATEGELQRLRDDIEELANEWESGRAPGLEWNVPIGETFAARLRDALTDAQGSQVVPEPARVAKYAEVIRREAATFEHDFPAGVGEVVGVPDAAFVAAAVADSELATMVADRDAHERHAEELSRTVAGLGDELDAARSEVDRLNAHAEAAEAKVARVEALADEWESERLYAALADAPADAEIEPESDVR